MNVLVGCEFSGRVRDAFRRKGHEAYSCDLLPNDSPYHLQQDINIALTTGPKWDLFIAFPPCTYLCSSGLHWNCRTPGRQTHTDEAARFFLSLANQPIPKIAIENPIGCMSRLYRKPDQIIQPYEFGEDASKSTCLWLKGLPPLVPTELVEPRVTPDGKRRWANQTDSGQNRLGPSDDRALIRSITYQGIADAMGEQWG